MRRHRSPIAWIAAFAVALQALWPLVAQAAPAERTLVLALCSVEHGAKQVEVRLGKSPLEERAATHGDHCKLCFFGGDKPAVAHASIVSVSSFRGEAEKPRANETGGSSQRLFVSARPRAPPHAS